MGTETLCQATRTLAGRLFRCILHNHGEPIFHQHRGSQTGYWTNQHIMRSVDDRA